MLKSFTGDPSWPATREDLRRLAWVLGLVWLALAAFATLAQRYLGWRLAVGLIGGAGALFTLGLLLVAAGSLAAASVEPGVPLTARDPVAAALRGFGPLGLLAILVILAGNLVVAPLSAVLVLAWARRSRTPWREIGYVRPKSWIGSLAVGVAFGIALKFLMKAIVMPLLGADPINHAYHYLVGNRAALPAMLFAVTVGAGFGEETLFRGYMFERFGKLFGHGARARTSIVLLTAAWFGLAHYPIQGLAGVEQATIVGLVFGTIFAVTGRLWMLMCAHAAFDLTALGIIYWNLEAEVARLVF